MLRSSVRVVVIIAVSILPLRTSVVLCLHVDEHSSQEVIDSSFLLLHLLDIGVLAVVLWSLHDVFTGRASLLGDIAQIVLVLTELSSEVFVPSEYTLDRLEKLSIAIEAN